MHVSREDHILMPPALTVAPISRLAARFPLLASLADRNFASFWKGRTISLSGDQFQTVARYRASRSMPPTH